MAAKKNPAAVALGRKGGQAKSAAKTAAVRANGQLGGRPKNFDRAMGCAEEYARLIALGRYNEAEALEFTIDDLVGSCDDTSRDFVWPAPIAEAAGVPAVRRRRKR